MDVNLRPLFEKASSNLIAPGGVVAVVKHGNLKAISALGQLDRKQDLNSKVNENTVYDIASLTKPLCTVNLCMLAVDKGLLKLNDIVSYHLPEAIGTFYTDVNISELLGHASGLAAHVRFFEDAWNEHGVSYTMPDKQLFQLILTSNAAYPKASKTTYSDLGFILLGKIVESVFGSHLDEVFKKEVAQKLKLSSTFFNRRSNNEMTDSLANTIAPTEQCDVRGRLQGVVHDENCFLLDGVAGHAGLFSTATDVTTMITAWLDSFHGESDFVSAQTLRTFWTTSAAPNTSWKLGFDTPSTAPGVSHAGDAFPRSALGHLGFTGTSFWMDPSSKNAIVMLTNRVYDSRDPKGIKSLRRDVMDSMTRLFF